mmetsp:Transcript_6925/g.17553  ORF Transcript_6925/g.17553 Transcript_6925/m.17553 type:complete len:182 (-) Transcript_6925:156-701(-)
MLGWVGAAIALGVMVVRRNRDKLFDANVIRSFGMYYKNYNMSNTMFFVIDLSYKFGEALFISILPDGGAQVGVMLVLEIALLVVVVIRRPFRTREDFAFIVAMTAGRIIVLFLSIALLPGVVEGVSQSGQDAVGYLMMGKGKGVFGYLHLYRYTQMPLIFHPCLSGLSPPTYACCVCSLSF